MASGVTDPTLSTVDVSPARVLADVARSDQGGGRGAREAFNGKEIVIWQL